MFGLPKGILGPITPLGGVMFVAGWLALLASTFQENEKRYRRADKE
ncbi:MAG: hypothetical protein R2795_02770 [Saprospiraceae bacterium]